MSTADIPARRYGLYYPYFHVRDDRWLKTAALYWPRIVRIVPEDYPTRDSETVRILTDELGFVRRQPPGASVQVVARIFIDLVSHHGSELRPLFAIPEEQVLTLVRAAAATERPILPPAHHQAFVSSSGSRLGAVHSSQILPAVVEALVEAELALPARIGLSHEVDRQWVVMDERLIAAYTSVLAHDFSTANRLQPITDQPAAFAMADEWNADHIAAALLSGTVVTPRSTAQAEMAQILAILALELVVPRNIDSVPAQRIVEIRKRYGNEFLAFGAAVDQAAAQLSDLREIRDRATLEDYLNDEVARRFEEPMRELQHQLAGMKLDTATLAINVKTQLPIAAVLAGSAWFSSHSTVIGAAAASLGLLGVGHGAREQRRARRHAAAPASFLLHTRGLLQQRGLLDHTLQQVRALEASSP